MATCENMYFAMLYVRETPSDNNTPPAWIDMGGIRYMLRKLLELGNERSMAFAVEYEQSIRDKIAKAKAHSSDSQPVLIGKDSIWRKYEQEIYVQLIFPIFYYLQFR